MALGRKTGGRRKGSKNRITAEHRVVMSAILDNWLPQLDRLIDETEHGIEIEKQLPDGTTVVGRLNADPGRAAKLVLEAYKLIHPPPVEVVGKGGEAIQVVIQTIGKDE